MLNLADQFDIFLCTLKVSMEATRAMEEARQRAAMSSNLVIAMTFFSLLVCSSSSQMGMNMDAGLFI